jgi:hypothetical protein
MRVMAGVCCSVLGEAAAAVVLLVCVAAGPFLSFYFLLLRCWMDTH